MNALRRSFTIRSPLINPIRSPIASTTAIPVWPLTPTPEPPIDVSDTMSHAAIIGAKPTVDFEGQVELPTEQNDRFRNDEDRQFRGLLKDVH